MLAVGSVGSWEAGPSLDARGSAGARATDSRTLWLDGHAGLVWCLARVARVAGIAR